MIYVLLNGELLTDSDGAPYEVCHRESIPVLLYVDGIWKYRVGENSMWNEVKTMPYRKITHSVYYGSFVVVEFPTGCGLVLVKSDTSTTFFEMVPNRAFYKTHKIPYF